MKSDNVNHTQSDADVAAAPDALLSFTDGTLADFKSPDEFFDMCFGVNHDRIDYQCSKLWEEEAVEAEREGNRLSARMEPPGFKLAGKLEAIPSLELRLFDVALNGKAWEPQDEPWTVRFRVPLALGSLSRQEVQGHKRMNPKTKRLLAQLADELHSLRFVYANFEALDLARDIDRSASRLPGSVPPADVVLFLRLLESHLKSYKGPDNPFLFMFLALSLDPARTSTTPDFEPTDAYFRPVNGLNGTKQLRLYLVTNQHKLPPTPEDIKCWHPLAMPIADGIGSLVLSERLLVHRLIGPRVKQTLGLKSDFSINPAELKESRTRDSSADVRIFDLWQKAYFRFVEDIRCTVSGRGGQGEVRFSDGQIKTLGAYALIELKGRHSRTLYWRTQLEQDYDPSRGSKATLDWVVKIYVHSPTKGEISTETDVERAIYIHREEKDYLYWFEQDKDYKNLVRPVLDALSDFQSDLYNVGKLKFDLFNLRVVLPDGALYDYKDPVVRPNSSSQGSILGGITLQFTVSGKG